MGAVRLNLARLRARPPRLDRSPDDSLDRFLDSLRTLRISRREVLQVASASYIGLFAPRAFAQSPPGEVRLVRDRGRATLEAEGTERFVIDVQRFGGRPSLKVSRHGDSLQLRLREARFAGLSLPADSVFTVRGTGPCARLEIRMALGGFRADVNLREWLAGDDVAESAVDLRTLACDLGGGISLAGAGVGIARFTPDWSLAIEGTRVATLCGLGEVLKCDTMAVRLLQKGAPSALVSPAARRSEIRVTAGPEGWHLVPPALDDALGTIEWADSAFDVLTVEASEPRNGRTRRAFIAQGPSRGPVAWYRSPTDTSEQRPVVLPLRNARFALATGNGAPSVALFADFESQPSWLHAGQCSVGLGSRPDTPGFEATGTLAGLGRLLCSPAVKALSLPMQDGVPGPIGFPESSPATSVALGNVRRTAAMKGVSVLRSERVVGTTSGLFIPGPILLPPAADMQVIRPDDLLAITFRFYNVGVYGFGATATLKPIYPGEPSFVVAEFPPQAILEEAFDDPMPTPLYTPPVMNSLARFHAAVTAPQPPAPPVGSVISGTSRVSFQLPANFAFAFRLANLLDWSAWTPYTEPGAGPENTHTALEIPWGLVVSLAPDARWHHSTTPRIRSTPSGPAWTELWHTRLSTPRTRRFSVIDDEATNNPAKLRAVALAQTSRWNLPDPTGNAAAVYDTDPFRVMSLNARDRGDIVLLTSGVPGSSYTGVPFMAKRLMLSALGGWLDSVGSWDQQERAACSTSLEEWRHVATMGRDQYVKTIRAGRLFPFGHKASYIQITERKVYRAPSGRATAYLLKRSFIVVRQPVFTYPTGDSLRGRQSPFQSVHILTEMTPNLDSVIPLGVSGVTPQEAFYPRTDGRDFRFRIEATDWDGNIVDLRAPLLFVDDKWASNPLAVGASTTPDAPQKIVKSAIDVDSALRTLDGIVTAANYASKEIDLAGQKLAYAQRRASDYVDKATGAVDEAKEAASKAATTLETRVMNFTASLAERTTTGAWKLAEDAVPGAQRYYAKLKKASVYVAAIQEMTGADGGAVIYLSDKYLTEGLINSGRVFAELDQTAKQVKAAVQFGLASPEMAITALSAQLGPVAGKLESYAKPALDLAQAAIDFKPSEFFDGVKAKILGVIDLKDLLKDLVGTTDPLAVPGLTKEVLEWDESRPPIKIPKVVKLTYTWQTTNLNGGDLPIVGAPLTGTDFAQMYGLRLVATMVKRVGLTSEELKSAPSMKVEARLQNFKVVLIPGGDTFDFLKITFDHFLIEWETGKGTSVTPKVRKVEFGNALAFISSLKDYLKFGGIGFDIVPGLTEIGVKGSIALPGVAVGVFGLQNISLHAGISIPFDDNPLRLSFSFCTPENPFVLSVLGLGGGGFIGLKINAKGFEGLALSLEFGAFLSLDFGVATGGIKVTGGVYMEWDYANKKIKIVAYIRLNGVISVLGIVDVTLDVRLELEYIYDTAKKKGILKGRAVVTVKVEVAMFNKTVSWTIERTLAGSDPPFRELMPSNTDWVAYCTAFAPAIEGR